MPSDKCKAYCTINEGQVNLLLGNPHVSVLDSRFDVCTSTRTEGFPWVSNGIPCWKVLFSLSNWMNIISWPFFEL